MSRNETNVPSSCNGFATSVAGSETESLPATAPRLPRSPERTVLGLACSASDTETRRAGGRSDNCSARHKPESHRESNVPQGMVQLASACSDHWPDLIRQEHKYQGALMKVEKSSDTSDPFGGGFRLALCRSWLVRSSKRAGSTHSASQNASSRGQKAY